MYPLLFSAIVTCLIFLFDAFLLKSKRKANQYLAFFLLMTGLQYFFATRYAQADIFREYLIEHKILLRSQIDIERGMNDDNESSLSKEKARPKTKKEVQKEFVKTCKAKMKYHHEEAKKCFKEATEGCLLFPNVEDQKKAEWCFTSAIASLYPGNPTQRIIAGVITLGAQYFSSVLAEWHYIDCDCSLA